MSVSSSVQPSSPAPTKGRSPMERIIVWGIIAILLALAAIEAASRSSYQQVADQLTKKLEQAEKGDTSLKAFDVKAVVGEKQPRVQDLKGGRVANNASRVEVYSWFTLNPFQKRELFVYYGVGSRGDEPDVVEVATAEAEVVDQEALKPTQEKLDEMSKNAPRMPAGGGAGAGASATAPDFYTRMIPADQKIPGVNAPREGEAVPENQASKDEKDEKDEKNEKNGKDDQDDHDSPPKTPAADDPQKPSADPESSARGENGAIRQS